MAKLQLAVVTAEGESFTGDVDMVVAPGGLGEFTVLPSHARMISSLDPGILRFDQSGESVSLALSGGFLEVSDNRVTVLADAAERDDAIDVERDITSAEVRERAKGKIMVECSDHSKNRKKLVEIINKINAVANPDGKGRDDLQIEILVQAEGICRRISSS